jgi:hypothetical protein
MDIFVDDSSSTGLVSVIPWAVETVASEVNNNELYYTCEFDYIYFWVVASLGRLDVRAVLDERRKNSSLEQLNVQHWHNIARAVDHL